MHVTPAATIQRENKERGERDGLWRSVDTWDTVFTSTETGRRAHNKAGNGGVVKIQAQSINPSVLE